MRFDLFRRGVARLPGDADRCTLLFFLILLQLNGLTLALKGAGVTF